MAVDLQGNFFEGDLMFRGGLTCLSKRGMQVDEGSGIKMTFFLKTTLQI